MLSYFLRIISFSDGFSCLHIACFYGYKEFVTTLLEAKVSGLVLICYWNALISIGMILYFVGRLKGYMYT